RTADGAAHAAPQPVPVPQRPKLSLIEEEELETSLAITTMVAKAESQLLQPLHALNLRLAQVMERAQLADADNPVGPARLADAFRTAAEALDLETEVRLVLFKLFERHVFGTLDGLYAALNLQLVQNGVLPTLPAALLPAAPPRPLARQQLPPSPSADAASFNADHAHG